MCVSDGEGLGGPRPSARGVTMCWEGFSLGLWDLGGVVWVKGTGGPTMRTGDACVCVCVCLSMYVGFRGGRWK